MTDSEHLALIDAVIQNRLGADAMEEYSQAYKRFRGTGLEALYRIRDQLQARIAASSGGQFLLAEPFDM